MYHIVPQFLDILFYFSPCISLWEVSIGIYLSSLILSSAVSSSWKALFTLFKCFYLKSISSWFFPRVHILHYSSVLTCCICCLLNPLTLSIRVLLNSLYGNFKNLCHIWVWF
jgi:hypothetical protein